MNPRHRAGDRLLLRKTLARVFAAAGLLAFGYWAFMVLGGRVYQAREVARFSLPQPAEAAPGPAERRPPESGSPVALLEIPRLGMSLVVMEGAEERELKLGPGHIRGTSLPGEGGNFAVAGHRDTFFRPLRLVRPNDAIKVVTHEKELLYRVVSTQIVGPRDVQVLYPTGNEVLTLVTCYPFDFAGAAPRRFIVRAECMDCGTHQAAPVL